MNDMKTLDQDKPGYYYEHVNGTIHYKTELVVDMMGGPNIYFEGPFVKHWWYICKLDDQGNEIRKTS